MPAPFTPVVCRCPKCRRLFVDWFPATDVVGKAPKRVLNNSCDICYAPLCTGEERANIVRLCLLRRQKMHELYWHDCDRSHLDTFYTQLLTRGPTAYSAHTPYGSDRPPYLTADRTQ
jgi:hypothetical protein